MYPTPEVWGDTAELASSFGGCGVDFGFGVVVSTCRLVVLDGTGAGDDSLVWIDSIMLPETPGEGVVGAIISGVVSLVVVAVALVMVSFPFFSVRGVTGEAAADVSAAASIGTLGVANEAISLTNWSFFSVLGVTRGGGAFWVVSLSSTAAAAVVAVKIAGGGCFVASFSTG